MRLFIEKIVYPGRSLALDQGKVVFTDRGLPGETVEVELFKSRKSYAEAKTLRIIESVPGRVEPRCRHYLACSPYQEIDYTQQLEIKKAQIEEILERGLKRTFEVPSVVPSPDIWGYRNRIRLRVIRENGIPGLAYHEPGEQASFVPVGRCHLVPEPVNDLAAEIIRMMGERPWDEVEEIEIRTAPESGEALVIFHLRPGGGLESPGLQLGEIRNLIPLAGAVGLVHSKTGTQEHLFFGRGYLEESVLGVRYRIGARSFFQVNRSILSAVFEDMRRAVDSYRDAVVADFYCGIGTFGVFLARQAREVFGIEPAGENISFLKKNMALNKVGNVNICEGTGEEWLPWILEKGADVVVLDPPRRGVDRAMIEALGKSPVPLILYLSCNPATLVRDLAGLLPAYEIQDLKIYDFFPHTHHIETLAVLRRNA